MCFAPTDSSILVTGPPGSGKTVVAIFRSNSLSEQDEDVKVVAFNQVLASYTSMGLDLLDLVIKLVARGIGFFISEEARDGQNTNDYITAAQNAREKKSERITEKGHWGHLILDEAQDFNFGAHSFLNTVRERVFSEFADEDKPHVTILADENQRLNDSNSTIEQIRQAHLFSSDDEYELKRNYRNTMEIAKFAAEFYVGLPTGIPELPDARGNKPKVVVTDDIDDAVSRITTHARTNDNEEIGVLVHYDRTRKKLFNKLKHRLEDDGFTVQTYGWRDGRDGARELQFDKPKTITVLCFASAKGLEFDTVFLPELQTYRTTDAAELSAKMTMYVMCSRARKTLSLMISDRDGDNDIWRLLPADRQLYELED